MCSMQIACPDSARPAFYQDLVVSYFTAVGYGLGCRDFHSLSVTYLSVSAFAPWVFDLTHGYWRIEWWAAKLGMNCLVEPACQLGQGENP